MIYPPSPVEASAGITSGGHPSGAAVELGLKPAVAAAVATAAEAEVPRGPFGGRKSYKDSGKLLFCCILNRVFTELLPIFFWLSFFFPDLFFFVEFVTEHVRSFLKMGSGCHNSGPLDPSRSGGSGTLATGCLAQAHFANLQSPGEGISRS